MAVDVEIGVTVEVGGETGNVNCVKPVHFIQYIICK